MTERKPMIAVLTGAGISTDSGIPDFRGPQGVWTKDPAKERLFTLQNYVRDPEVRKLSWQARLASTAWSAKPNKAHLALAELQKAGVATRILTQNIDGLHQAAGSHADKVLELHGTMFSVRCMDCGDATEMKAAIERVEAGEQDPACRLCGGILKAGTIMFGEALDESTIDLAARICLVCTHFWAIGTSLTVHPVAGLCDLAWTSGAEVTIVNNAATPYDHLAHKVIREPIGESVPKLVEDFLKQR
ncbi:MAG TPA: Sir2 family NAD-dependent protein deacetylase [Candidatus Limnocylindrales bacterium]|nr:Sir2 family NAD-dependent protein deacetylase [Candidatus Limnocylindrales bacterium]